MKYWFGQCFFVPGMKLTLEYVGFVSSMILQLTCSMVAFDPFFALLPILASRNSLPAMLSENVYTSDI